MSTTLEDRATDIKTMWNELMDCVKMHSGNGLNIVVNDRSFTTQNMERTIRIEDAELKITVEL